MDRKYEIFKEVLSWAEFLAEIQESRQVEGKAKDELEKFSMEYFHLTLEEEEEDVH